MCPYCQMAKQLLSDLWATYEEKIVEMWSDELMEIVRTTGMMTVPQIFNWDISKENLLGGYSEIAELHKQGKLESIITNTL